MTDSARITKPERKPETWEAAWLMAQAELFRIGRDRHTKYGPTNISYLGERGVFARLSDKIARLKRAVWDSLAGMEKDDESVDDTWGDLANYATIALMVRWDWWGLPAVCLGDASASVPTYQEALDALQDIRNVADEEADTWVLDILNGLDGSDA